MMLVFIKVLSSRVFHVEQLTNNPSLLLHTYSPDLPTLPLLLDRRLQHSILPHQLLLHSLQRRLVRDAGYGEPFELAEGGDFGDEHVYLRGVS